MKTYDIAVIGGDGTGPEVVREAIKVLDAAASKFNLKINYTNYDLGRRPLSADRGSAAGQRRWRNCASFRRSCWAPSAIPM